MRITIDDADRTVNINQAPPAGPRSDNPMSDMIMAVLLGIIVVCAFIVVMRGCDVDDEYRHGFARHGRHQVYYEPTPRRGDPPQAPAASGSPSFSPFPPLVIPIPGFFTINP